jgi:hypothetical protein
MTVRVTSDKPRRNRRLVLGGNLPRPTHSCGACAAPMLVNTPSGLCPFCKNKTEGAK